MKHLAAGSDHVKGAGTRDEGQMGAEFQGRLGRGGALRLGGFVTLPIEDRQGVAHLLEKFLALSGKVPEQGAQVFVAPNGVAALDGRGLAHRRRVAVARAHPRHAQHRLGVVEGADDLARHRMHDALAGAHHGEQVARHHALGGIEVDEVLAVHGHDHHAVDGREITAETVEHIGKGDGRDQQVAQQEQQGQAKGFQDGILQKGDGRDHAENGCPIKNRA